MRRLLCLGFLIFCSAASLAHAESVAYAAEGTPKEYELKAAFLYNFAKFIEWPPAVNEEIKDSFVIGIFGRDPFGREIDAMLSSKTINERKIEVKRFSNLEMIEPCHILFVGSSEIGKLDQVIDHLEGKSVLTVGETGVFAASGGMIGFVMEDNKIKFEINKQATDKVGLKLSSQLLKLAKSIT